MPVNLLKRWHQATRESFIPSLCCLIHTGTEFRSHSGYQLAEISTGYGHWEQPSVCSCRESSSPPPNFPKLSKQKKETSQPPTKEEVKQWKALLRHLTGIWSIFSETPSIGCTAALKEDMQYTVEFHLFNRIPIMEQKLTWILCGVFFKLDSDQKISFYKMSSGVPYCNNYPCMVCSWVW